LGELQPDQQGRGDRHVWMAPALHKVKNQLDHLDIDTPLNVLDVQTVGNA
jgi:hypothetical protein